MATPGPRYMIPEDRRFLDAHGLSRWAVGAPGRGVAPHDPAAPRGPRATTTPTARYTGERQNVAADSAVPKRERPHPEPDRGRPRRQHCPRAATRRRDSVERRRFAAVAGSAGDRRGG